MKLVAVMMVRNEAMILPVNLAYHRSLGVDEFWIIDNGSTDGTIEFLSDSERTHGDIRWRSDPEPLHQGDATTSIAAEAIEGGADWILPIDADEFWWSEDGALRATLVAASDVGALVCGVDNFVQRRSVHTDRPDSLMTMTYRADPIGTMDTARELVETGEIGFVEMVYPPKQILRASADLVIGIGNHTASNVAGQAVRSSEIRVLHAPIRSRGTLVQRAETGRRRAAVYSSPNASWHQRRWTRMADDGTIDDDWLANSQRFGRLRVGGIHHRLIRDSRLKRSVAPYVKQPR